MTPRVITGIVLVVLTLIFVVQNTHTVDIRFLFWTISMSRVLLILFFLFIGFSLGWIACSLYAHRPETKKPEK